MVLAGRDTPSTYLKDGVDWILENSFLAIELLITGAVFQIVVLVVSRPAFRMCRIMVRFQGSRQAG